MSGNPVPPKLALFTSKKKLLLLIGIFILVFFFLYYQIPKPPDLSRCNRIVIRYHPSTYDFFMYSLTLIQSVLSQEEEKYVESFNSTLEVTDMVQIKNFAHGVSLTSFSFFGIINPNLYAQIDCYDNNNLLSHFYISNGDIITKHGIKYENPFNNTFELTDMLLPLGVKPLQLRSSCARGMLFLNKVVLKPKYKVSYPDPNRWCDLVSRTFTNTEDQDILEWLQCHAANEGKCNYAMNPNCKVDSPKDVVLLFETKDGWNQHSGPELFTFDNHDPKGGCVLLNDGTVKFIRTKEELNALRWK
jgi:hypothetical protein